MAIKAKTKHTLTFSRQTSPLVFFLQPSCLTQEKYQIRNKLSCRIISWKQMSSRISQFGRSEKLGCHLVGQYPLHMDSNSQEILLFRSTELKIHTCCLIKG